jgi:hypothetical protein
VLIDGGPEPQPPRVSPLLFWALRGSDSRISAAETMLVADNFLQKQAGENRECAVRNGAIPTTVGRASTSTSGRDFAADLLQVQQRVITDATSARST